MKILAGVSIEPVHLCMNNAYTITTLLQLTQVNVCNGFKQIGSNSIWYKPCVRSIRREKILKRVLIEGEEEEEKTEEFATYYRFIQYTWYLLLFVDWVKWM